jgi:hypothetical protein
MPSPNSGDSSSNAWPISATSVRPVAWKVAAATIRMAALMNSASIKAMVESVVAHLIASRRPLSFRS